MNYQKRITPVLLLLLLAAPSLFAQDNPFFKHIPADATAIIQVNLPVFTAKMSWQDIVGSVPVPQKKSKSGLWILLKDPAGAGIDIGQDIFLAEKRDTATGKVVDMTYIVHLKDSAGFASFLRKNYPGLSVSTHKIAHGGKIELAAQDGIGASKAIGAAWNKDIGIIVFSNPPDHSPEGAVISRAAGKSLAAFEGFSQTLYTTDANFKTGFSDDADIHIWACQGYGLALMSAGFGPLSPSSGNSGIRTSMFKNKNKTLSAIRFRAGSLTIESETFLPPGGLATSPLTRPLNTDLLARVPPGNLLGFISLGISLQGIDALLTKTGYRNKLDSQLARKHLSLDTLLHAFKGDVLVAVTEPGQVNPQEKPHVPVYFVAAIDDLPSFNRLAAGYRQMKDSVKPDSLGRKPDFLGKIKGVSGIKDNLLVVSSDKKYVDAYLGNTEKRNTDFIPAIMNDNPVNVLIDFKTVADLVQQMAGKQPAAKDKKILDVLGALDRLTFSGGAVKEGKAKTFFELRLTDQKENSLKTLVGLMH